MPEHYGYILRGSVTGLFKIGVTRSPRDRMAAYRTHTPERIIQECVKTFLNQDEALDWEAAILHQHKDVIEHGEWLGLTFEEAAKICCAEAIASWWSLPDCEHLAIFETYLDSHFPDDQNKRRVTRAVRCDSRETLDALIDYVRQPSFVFSVEAPRLLTQNTLVAMMVLRLRSQREFEKLLNGQDPKFPKDFNAMSTQAQAAWLDANHPLEVK